MLQTLQAELDTLSHDQVTTKGEALACVEEAIKNMPTDIRPRLQAYIRTAREMPIPKGLALAEVRARIQQLAIT